MMGQMPALKWLKIADIKIPDKRLHSHLEVQREFEDSIKTEGVLNPIFVFEDEEGDYYLADGQNRLEIAKKQGEVLIPAYVLKGSEEDAALYSVKLNVLKGNVNAGELAEFLAYLKTSFKWNNRTIAQKVGLSESYVSQLLAISQDRELVEKLKKGLISKNEALKSLKVLPSKTAIAIHEKSETLMEPSISEVEKEEIQQKEGLSDEDLVLTEGGLTTSLKEAITEGKRFKPLSDEDLKPSEEGKKTEYMRCDYCGQLLSRSEVKWLKVHNYEYDASLMALEKDHAKSKKGGENGNE